MSKAPFTIHRFWTEYPADGKGGYAEIDWVEYGPPGTASEKTKTRSKVSTLVNYLDNPTNPASRLAKVRGEYIKQMHAAWKAGQGIVETGTPLAAWNGVTPEQADILRTKGFKSIEAVAEMTDTDRQNVPLPGMLKIIGDAKRFLETADRRKISDELAVRDEQMALMREQVAESNARQNEMARMIEELLAEKRQRIVEAREEDEPPAKRRPGRPRAEQQAAA